jgi:hypothetical protein
MSHLDNPESIPDLDDALSELRQSMADVGVVAGIIADLRRNADRTMPTLTTSF